MTFAATLLLAAAILPSDRLAMADRLFDKGDRRNAKAEYEALRKAGGLSDDDLLFRIAECERLDGNMEAARRACDELLATHPLSRHAPRARLARAIASRGAEKLRDLKLLDADAVPADVRAAALYHYGTEAKDAAALGKCIELQPSGQYAPYAKFRRAIILLEDADPARRRSAVGDLFDLHRGGDKRLAPQALYSAASATYSARSYAEASALFRKYAKTYPGDAKTPSALNLAAWSDYLDGRYAEAAALCEGGKTDDAAYLLAMCAYKTGDLPRSLELIEKYCGDWPQGKHLKALELPKAAARREAAEKSGDAKAFLAAARRCAELSKAPADALRYAWALEKSGRSDEAAAAYADVAKAHPGTDAAAEALFRKAVADVRANRWQAAELAMAESLAAMDRNPGGAAAKRRAEALYWRGIATMRLGMADEGAAFLTQALAGGLPIDESREARLAIADADFRAGREAKAKDAWARLAREGAAKRMDGAQLRKVGRFLLECREGEPAADAAQICANELAAIATTPDWRQAAFALLGAAQEAAGELSAAIGSYRRAMAENVRTPDARAASLSLGSLLAKSGETGEAEGVLKEAVALNADDGPRRALAYLWLAKCREAAQDPRGACAYATVVTTLFPGGDCAAEAAELLARHPEEAEAK